MKTITSRLKYLINCNIKAAKKFKELEELTHIPSGTWRTWWNRDTTPSAEMIETIAKEWPVHAFWLATGFDDGMYGHTAPGDEGYPSHANLLPNSAAYFLAVRDCQFAAENIAQEWYKSMFDEQNQTLDIRMSNEILRAMPQIGLPAEMTATLSEKRRNLLKAEKLRRAEIMLELEMPRISYDDTEALGNTIKKLLDEVANIGDDQAPKAILEQKLSHELERLRRHREFENALSKT